MIIAMEMPGLPIIVSLSSSWFLELQIEVIPKSESLFLSPLQSKAVSALTFPKCNESWA
jgi:hypothetical protein